MAEVVYKILDADEWRRALAAGRCDGSADDRRDGFIHLSSAGQVAGTLWRHFAGRRDLVLVALDVARLGVSLRFEASRGGALFPHLYSSFDVTAVREVTALEIGPDGQPVLPDELGQ